MDVRQLRYFTAIASLGSFTRAAEALRIAQPALSMHVKSLEAELGTPLLIRHSRGVEPTLAGKLFAHRARRILDEVDSARGALSDKIGHDFNQITIGVLQNDESELTTRSVQQVAEWFPEMTIHVEEAIGPVILQGVLDGRIDLGFVYHIDDLPIDDLHSHIAYEQLSQDEFLFVHAPNVDSPQSELTMAQAIKHRLILPPSPHPLRALVEAAARESGGVVSIAAELGSLRSRIELVEQSRGASFFPLSTIAGRLGSGSLVAHKMRPAFFRKKSLVYRQAEAPLWLERIRSILKHTSEGDLD